MFIILYSRSSSGSHLMWFSIVVMCCVIEVLVCQHRSPESSLVTILVLRNVPVFFSPTGMFLCGFFCAECFVSTLGRFYLVLSFYFPTSFVAADGIVCRMQGIIPTMSYWSQMLVGIVLCPVSDRCAPHLSGFAGMTWLDHKFYIIIVIDCFTFTFTLLKVIWYSLWSIIMCWYDRTLIMI